MRNSTDGLLGFKGDSLAITRRRLNCVIVMRMSLSLRRLQTRTIYTCIYGSVLAARKDWIGGWIEARGVSWEECTLPMTSRVRQSTIVSNLEGYYLRLIGLLPR